MGVIKELDSTLGTLYAKYSSDGEMIQKSGVVGFHKHYKDKDYFIITDLYGRRITEANHYLNVVLAGSGYKKKEMAFTALKLFYSYVDLFNFYSYRQGFMEKEDLSKFFEFLEGGKHPGNAWIIDFKTSRCANTLNNYVSIYRDFYIKMFKIKDSLIHDKSIVGTYSGGGMMGHANKQVQEKYKESKKVPKSTKAPKYIKYTQYKDIIKLIEKKYTTRDLVLVKLMYDYGLRLGEAISLTLEDIGESSTEPGTYKLVLRRRFSDRPDQAKKGLMSIKSPEDYKKKAYETERYGFCIVVIEEDMMDLLEEYIDETFDEFTLSKYPKKKKNLDTYTKADKISDREDISENYYLFLSRQNYRPLTQAGWNYTCRKIFEEIGIPVDSGSKEKNLSHRFRHGFAMVRAKNGWAEVELAEALRHSSTTSVKKYYNPDEEDTVDLLKRKRDYSKEEGGINFDD
ncbi:tyrosine-type recombinase/integrase [Bacillus luti]|uniref:tyrosine-type recombinase/integrase n=1 Tax=Bacillus luti TaxID=2026191 RepID=UPI003CFFF55A